GKFREVVGRMQVAGVLLPIAGVNEVVPIRDLVVHRAAGVTIRNAAIHSARGLLARVFLRQRDDGLAVVADALLDHALVTIVSIELEESTDLAHRNQAPAAASRG